MENTISFIDGHGHKIFATLSNPTDRIVPIMLLFHGLDHGRDSKANIALEKILLENNLATLDVDFYACGKNDGSSEDRNIEEFVENILSAIKFIKEKGYTKIGIYGCSFGGVASVIASSRNLDLSVMALKAPGMGQSSRKLPNYIKDFETKSWIKAGIKVKIPTLIVHGSMDKDVELSQSKELIESIKFSKIEILEGSDHRFTKKEDFDKCIKLLSDFIISNMTKI
ncbi:MAG: alpha/beta hydrolase family protein [Candidatus Woesearchaeota archaeon]